MVEISQAKIDFDFRTVSNGVGLSITFGGRLDWTHYEIGEKFGLVAFLSREDEQSPSHVKIAELMLDERTFPMLVHPTSYDAFWTEEKLELYQRMNNWLSENCHMEELTYINLKQLV